MRASLFLAVAVLSTPAFAAPPILGGTQATNGEFPNVVVLEVGQGLCTGTLITKDWILTAAHCVTPSVVGSASQAALTSSIKVHFGTTNLRLSPGTVVGASDSIPDPGFNANNLGSHDAGLIKLKTPVTNVAPTAINFTAAKAPIGIAVTMVGFGATATGGGGNVGIEMVVAQTSQSCAGIGSDTDLLCFSQVSGKGKCEGDSGGPSFATIDGHQVEVGITSFGDQSCAQFGADTRVDAEQAFLLAHVPELSPCAVDTDCTTADEICFKSQCILGPSASTGLGATCTQDSDCQSGTCGAGPGGMFCADACTVGAAGACPASFDCVGANTGAGVCWLASETGGGGGCDAGAGGVPALFGTALFGFLALRRRRS